MKHIAALFVILIFAFYSCRAMKRQTVITITFTRQKEKTIRVHKGDTLLIKLQMASGTGFVWQAAGKLNLCRQADTKYEQIKSNMPGSTLIEVMNLIIVSSGVEEITFVYRRPFENTAAAAKTKILHLIVE